MGESRVRRRIVGLLVVLTAGATMFVVNAGSSSAVQFCNTAPIVGDGGQGNAPFSSSPYPSNITVAGLTGTITDVNITLLDVTTTGDQQGNHFPEDLDVEVVSPATTAVMVMSDAGGDNTTSHPLTNVDLNLDQQAANQLPADTTITSGTWRPVDDDDDTGEQIALNADPFNAPAPAPGGSTLDAFNGGNPNGTWSLYAVDDVNGAATSISGGWCVDILTTTDPTTTSTSTSSTTSTSTTSTSTTSTSTTVPTTTSSSTTSTTVPTTTSSSTTSTTVPTTTSSSTSTSTSSTSSTSTSTSSTTSTTVATTTTLSANACGGTEPTIIGTSGDDYIFGTPGPDVINGLGGNDTIYGYGGEDIICGGTGEDRIFGGTENDRLFGDAGHDTLFGEDGNDNLSGAAGIDRLNGGNGDDTLDGGTETDLCAGDAGTDSATACESISTVP